MTKNNKMTTFYTSVVFRPLLASRMSRVHPSELKNICVQGKTVRVFSQNMISNRAWLKLFIHNYLQ